MAQRTPTPERKSNSRRRLRARYDRLWSDGIGKLRRGRIEIDPVLATGQLDRRRGLTVIARPSPAVRQSIGAFLRELRALESEQYYYEPSEFHLTVLSLFTATAEHPRFYARLKKYISAVDSVLRNAEPIRVEFIGVTASPAAIMIQGFCDNERLNGLRDALRQELRERKLTEGLDVRYRLKTAHMTVVRFRAQLRNAALFTQALERARHRKFGATRITTMALVKNDWYMSRQTLESIGRYVLD